MKEKNIVAPAIFVYENVLDDPQSIIDLAESESGWIDSSVYDSKGNLVEDKNIRNTKILDIIANYKNDEKWWLLSKLIWTYGDQYGKDNMVNFGRMEDLQLLKYHTGEGFYEPHYDNGPSSPRTFSAILYLNDVEKGGETYFTNFNISIKPKSGRLVIFPANFAYMHSATMPKSNDKYAIVTWFSEIILA